MSAEPLWPPPLGELLPRAEDAYAEPRKLAWILSEEGHGREWARVLRIGPRDTNRFWVPIAHAVVGATIFRVQERFGTICGANISLVIGLRCTRATTSWHYEHALDAPRLVTAYPRL